MTNLRASLSSKSEYGEGEGQSLHSLRPCVDATWACGPVGYLLISNHDPGRFWASGPKKSLISG